ncbi:MAG: hypothetical protein RQ866_09085 [Bacteroidales bacterium]|nr:hypothetical protein [Bacteroidales bacterium]
MKTLKNILLLGFPLFFTISCVYTEDITFNNDFSGKIKMHLDFTFFMEVGQDSSFNEESTAREFDAMLADIKNQLSEIEGVSNVDYEYDIAGTYSILYDFNSLEALNNATAQLKMINDFKEEGKGIARSFRSKGKRTLYIDHSPVVSDSLNETAGWMLSYNLNIDFARDIKNISGCDTSGNSSCDSIQYNENVMNYSGDIGTFYHGAPSTLAIKLGKKHKL